LVIRLLLFCFLIVLTLSGSAGCVTRIPALWDDYSNDFTPAQELLGCPDLTGIYLVTGQATDYLITFPMPLFVPVWWGKFSEPPRLDVDLGLAFEGDVAVEVPGATRVRIWHHPDARRVMFMPIDDSGNVIEGFEEVEFTRTGSGFIRPHEWQPTFHCLIDYPPPSILIGTGLVIPRGDRSPETGTYEMTVMLGRLPDGTLAVRTHAYMWSSGVFFVDQQWHRYDSAPSPDVAH
jgi:hypothetical protein